MAHALKAPGQDVLKEPVQELFGRQTHRAGAMILAGVTVGEFSMVGASAVVTKDVPPYALVVGAPARVRGWVCECGLPLRFKQGRAICADCGLRYRARGSRIAVVDPTR